MPGYLPDETRNPSVFLGDRAMLVVNWEDIPRKISVPCVGRELISDKSFTLADGRLTVSLLPHESFAGTYK